MANRTRRSQWPADWWAVKPTPIIRKYEGLFDELGAPLLTTNIPYTNATWGDWFTRNPLKPLWKIKKDEPGKSLSVDLIAMAERFSPSHNERSFGAAFGSACADSRQIWIPVLDGGVLLQFYVVEDEPTNSLSGYQTTIVGGSACFRFLLQQLGFEPLTRRLKGEDSVPSAEEREGLIKDQLAEGTEAHKKLLEAAAIPRTEWLSEF